MDYTKNKFTTLIIIFSRLFFFLIVLGCIAICFLSFINLSLKNIFYLFSITFILLLACSILWLFIYKLFKNKCSHNKILLIILILAFSLRLTYVLLIKAKPFSDFGTLYVCGKNFALGNYLVFKGTSYLARFPHLTITAIYLGFIDKLYPNSLFPIRLINVIFSTINIYIIYLLSFQLYKSKEKALVISFIACIFPPFIFYNTVLCSENLAMTFFLIAVYIFLLIIKNEMNSYLIFASGLLLSIGNLFRMVGVVILLDYILYWVIYCKRTISLKLIPLLIVSFLIPLFAVNSLLLKLNITEYPLWHGREPAITSVLKGTNINSLGMWNEEDSQIPEKYNFNYNKIEAASMSIIKSRLMHTSLYKLAGFYIAKFIAQWSNGDFSGVYWSTESLTILSSKFSLSTILFFYCQIIYTLLIIHIFLQLLNKKQYLNNNSLYLLYIIFCSFALFYILIEQQPRYGYIISWVFILLINPCPYNIFPLTKKV